MAGLVVHTRPCGQSRSLPAPKARWRGCSLSSASWKRSLPAHQDALACSVVAGAGVAAAVSSRRRKGRRRRGRAARVCSAAVAAEVGAWRSWAEKLGIEAAKVELAQLQDGYGSSLRGMVATGPVESDEPVIEVPAGRVLQVTTGDPCPLGDAVVEPGTWRRMPWWSQLAALLLHEVRRGSESPLSDWLASLPQDFPEIPMNWTAAELDMLEYPPLVANVLDQRAELERAYKDASAGCAFDFSAEEFVWAAQCVRSRAFSGPYEGRGAEDRLVQLGFIAALLLGSVAGGFISWENGFNGALAAALAIPLTDFLVGQTSQLKRHVVCPVVDYLNHDSRSVSDIAYEYFDNSFAVRVRGGFRPGEQVCINYGEKRSNDALLQYYGFVERDNAQDTYRLDLLQHLDEQAAASGQQLQVELGRQGPDERSMAKLLQLLCGGDDQATAADEALAWKAVALACEAELQRRASGSAHELEALSAGRVGVVARFAAEKEKVLLACRAHAEARIGKTSSAAPLSLTRKAVLLPTFHGAERWRHEWADSVLNSHHLEELRTEGYSVIDGAFDEVFAAECLKECEALDGNDGLTVTTNRCNRGSRSTWLEFEEKQDLAALQQQLPALSRLSLMLAGLPLRLTHLGGLSESDEALRVHPATMIAVYPEQAAQYALHKDSYAPWDNDPATGASRRVTVLAYMNDWSPDSGGELQIYEASNDRPDPRRFRALPPKAGSLVLFDSRKVWHAVAPSTRGKRWAMTLWIH